MRSWGGLEGRRKSGRDCSLKAAGTLNVPTYSSRTETSLSHSLELGNQVED